MSDSDERSYSADFDDRFYADEDFEAVEDLEEDSDDGGSNYNGPADGGLHLDGYEHDEDKGEKKREDALAVRRQSSKRVIEDIAQPAVKETQERNRKAPVERVLDHEEVQLIGMDTSELRQFQPSEQWMDELWNVFLVYCSTGYPSSSGEKQSGTAFTPDAGGHPALAGVTENRELSVQQQQLHQRLVDELVRRTLDLVMPPSWAMNSHSWPAEMANQLDSKLLHSNHHLNLLQLIFLQKCELFERFSQASDETSARETLKSLFRTQQNLLQLSGHKKQAAAKRPSTTAPVLDWIKKLPVLVDASAQSSTRLLGSAYLCKAELLERCRIVTSEQTSRLVPSRNALISIEQTARKNIGLEEQLLFKGFGIFHVYREEWNERLMVLYAESECFRMLKEDLHSANSSQQTEIRLLIQQIFSSEALLRTLIVEDESRQRYLQNTVFLDGKQTVQRFRILLDAEEDDRRLLTRQLMKRWAVVSKPFERVVDQIRVFQNEADDRHGVQLAESLDWSSILQWESTPWAPFASLGVSGTSFSSVTFPLTPQKRNLSLSNGGGGNHGETPTADMLLASAPHHCQPGWDASRCWFDRISRGVSVGIDGDHRVVLHVPTDPQSACAGVCTIAMHPHLKVLSTNHHHSGAFDGVHCEVHMKWAIKLLTPCEWLELGFATPNMLRDGHLNGACPACFLYRLGDGRITSLNPPLVSYASQALIRRRHVYRPGTVISVALNKALGKCTEATISVSVGDEVNAMIHLSPEQHVLIPSLCPVFYASLHKTAYVFEILL